MPNPAAEQAPWTNAAARPAVYSDRALAPISVRRRTLKNRNEPVTLPKLHVVLATGSMPCRLLVDAVDFAAQITRRLLSTTNTLYRMMVVPSQRGTVIVIECPSKSGRNSVAVRGTFVRVAIQL